VCFQGCMCKYDRTQSLSNTEFKRLVGVKRPTFEAMMEVLQEHETEKRQKGGSSAKLCIGDQILVMLEYYREYRTMAHIAFDYGVSESTISRTIHEVEEVLIQSGRFSLPGRKALTGDPIAIEAIVVDATEVTIERPKKSKETTTPENAKPTPSKDRS